MNTGRRSPRDFPAWHSLWFNEGAPRRAEFPSTGPTPVGIVRPGGLGSTGAFLNGSNGEWTNSDDMPRKGKAKQQAQMAQVQQLMSQLKLKKKKAPKIKGRGAYSVGQMVRAGEAGLHMLEPRLAPFTRTLRSIIESFAKPHVRGNGDYAVTNDLFTTPIVPSGAVVGDPAHGITVSNTFNLGALTTPASGNQVYPFDISPRISAWLAAQGALYQMVKFNKFIVHFTSSLAIAATGTVGFVVMGASFDPYADAPGTRRELLALESAVEAKSTENIEFGVEMKRSMHPTGLYYCNPTSTTDIGFKSAGKVYVGVYPGSAVAGGTEIGDVDVLVSATFYGTRAPQGLYGYFRRQMTGGATASPLGTTTVAEKLAGLLIGTVATSTTITFPILPQNTLLRVKFAWQNISVGVTYNNPTTIYTNCAVGPAVYNGGTSTYLWAPAVGATSVTSAVQEMLVVISTSYSAAVLTIGTAGVIPENKVDITVDIISANYSSAVT